jgi:hypothetical protein
MLNMDIAEVKCANCGKDIYVLGEYVKDKMFCTLGCMAQFEKLDSPAILHGHNFEKVKA